MTTPERPEWLLYFERSYQKLLNEAREFLLSDYSFDSSSIQVKLTILEKSKRPGRQSAYKIRITLSDLLTLDLEDLWEIENAAEFIEPLSMIGEVCVPITMAYKLNRLELSPHLKESEIAALTHFATILLCNKAALLLVEEEIMNRQPAILQEVWKDMYLMRPEKYIEYQGIRYWRCDDPISWHA